MTESSPVLGFIGLGSMGGAIARRIAAAGFPLVVFDVRAQAMVDFPPSVLGAATAREVGDRADIVLACLTTNGIYADALLGPEGLTGGERFRGYVHLGTNGARNVEAWAAALAAKGVRTLDAPVSGGPTRASEGRLTTMASGDEALLRQIESALQSYSSKIAYLSDRVGAAQVMKLVNNALSITNMVVAAEALVLGQKAGLKLGQMLDVINDSSGVNSATSYKIPNFVSNRRFDFGGAMALTLKDVVAYHEEGRLSGTLTPIGDRVVSVLQDAMKVSPQFDITEIVRYFEGHAGVILED